MEAMTPRATDRGQSWDHGHWDDHNTTTEYNSKCYTTVFSNKCLTDFTKSERTIGRLGIEVSVKQGC